MTPLFPMFVKIAGRKCVVVGAGEIAESKIQGLLASGASVLVVSPEANQSIEELAVAGRLQWARRAFRASDLKGAALVIAATDSREVNRKVFGVAERWGILCNAVDQPEECHFYYPAVVRRGALQIAISTSGTSPALAHRLREELQEQFGPEYEPYLAWLQAIRQVVFTRRPDPARRQRLLKRFAARKTQKHFEARRGSRP